jgi:large repetitive protein
MKLIKLFLLGVVLSIGCVAQTHSVALQWSWTQGSGPAASGFNIYRATSPTGTFTIVGTAPSTTLAYTDTSPAVQTSGASFYYYVTSFNSSGESTPSNTASATIPFALAPATGLQATAK